MNAYLKCIRDIQSQLQALKNRIPDMKYIAKQDKQTELDERSEKTMKALCNSLKDALFSEFEEVLSMICSKYYHTTYRQNPKCFQSANLALASELYEVWKLFFGEKCPKWLDKRAEECSVFTNLFNIATRVNREAKLDRPPSVLFSALQKIVEHKRSAESNDTTEQKTPPVNYL